MCLGSPDICGVASHHRAAPLCLARALASDRFRSCMAWSPLVTVPGLKRGGGICRFTGLEFRATEEAVKLGSSRPQWVHPICPSETGPGEARFRRGVCWAGGPQGRGPAHGVAGVNGGRPLLSRTARVSERPPPRDTQSGPQAALQTAANGSRRRPRYCAPELPR